MFSDLQSFLDIYYQSCAVLDSRARLLSSSRARTWVAHAANGVRHAEIFFDPQTHTDRGVSFETVVRGIDRAMADAEPEGISSSLILCFLRHLPAEAASATLEQALAFRHLITGVGLDSSEVGNPPSKFRDVFRRAAAEGLRIVAHAGEEGPPDYIWQALDVLGVERVDHGVRCLEDSDLVRRLESEHMPLTVCPFSNVKLRVVPTLDQHPLGRMLEHGLCATVNSDDPAYFGGYVGENLAASAAALRLGDDAVLQLARNSFTAAFIDDRAKAQHLAEIDAAAAASAG